MSVHAIKGDIFTIDLGKLPHALVLWVSQGYNGMSAEFDQFIDNLGLVTIHEFQGGEWELLDGVGELPRGSGEKKRMFRIRGHNRPDQFLYLIPVVRPQIQDLHSLVVAGLSFCKDQGVATVAFNGIKPVDRRDVPENANAMVKAGIDWLKSNPEVSVKSIWFVDKKGRFNPE